MPIISRRTFFGFCIIVIVIVGEGVHIWMSALKLTAWKIYNEKLVFAHFQRK
jgi:hypothetical protein